MAIAWAGQLSATRYPLPDHLLGIQHPGLIQIDELIIALEEMAAKDDELVVRLTKRETVNLRGEWLGRG